MFTCTASLLIGFFQLLLTVQKRHFKTFTMQNNNVCFYKNNQDEEVVRSSTLKLQNYEISSHVLKR